MDLEPDDSSLEPGWGELLDDIGSAVADEAREHPKLTAGLAAYGTLALGTLGYLGEQAIAAIVGGL